ncbi:MAG: histidine--tRNA ligase [Planctomycetes bacterium]|jgi:histidyl-tRNA synthetase|nr:histidine--tRNA ligase [Planctomycetota bacterium]MBT4028607.1 histidine--tRNA ligase [Planctomycetota bacterium]MBT4559499.1 histidine--tRNA ligase [Planctomycetota bacterium]MBT7318974.1 histidine--tRNA ligase [Planctomycetota bacterium]
MASSSYQAPRGTRDLYPENLAVIRHLERTASRLSRAFGYSEIRPPLFEETGLFLRSLGETSDVVSKEMFTVPRRGKANDASSSVTGYTFRPEGTAGVARAYVNGGFAQRAPLQKWFYVGPMFRYERPQKGRERQFTQFGIEAFGAASPTLDAEVVDLCMRFFEEIGFGDELEVRVNTMGDPSDRDRWCEALRQFFAPRVAARCSDCQERFERNVFRLLDCKNKACQDDNEGSPALSEVLGVDAQTHQTDFLKALQALGRKPVVDPTIVRGLDYYTRTVFEVHYPQLGARSALCGGGRYDGLVEEFGGPHTPAVGFAIGFTATELAMAELGLDESAAVQSIAAESIPVAYCVSITPDDRPHALALAGRLRTHLAAAVVCDHREKSPKAQFKEANKLGVRFVLVVGPDERAAGQVVVRDMQTRDETRVELLQIAAHLAAATEA